MGQCLVVRFQSRGGHTAVSGPTSLSTSDKGQRPLRDAVKVWVVTSTLESAKLAGIATSALLTLSFELPVYSCGIIDLTAEAGEEQMLVVCLL